MLAQLSVDTRQTIGKGKRARLFDLRALINPCTDNYSAPSGLISCLIHDLKATIFLSLPRASDVTR